MFQRHIRDLWTQLCNVKNAIRTKRGSPNRTGSPREEKRENDSGSIRLILELDVNHDLERVLRIRPLTPKRENE